LKVFFIPYRFGYCYSLLTVKPNRRGIFSHDT
jgi:hypothetical protein